MYAGVITAFGPLTPQGGKLGFLYSSRTALVCFGIWFFITGAMMVYGKIRKDKRWIARALIQMYCCYTFAFVLNGIALGFSDVGSWLGNFIGIFVSAGLYLRWRFAMFYVPKDKLALTRTKRP